MNIQVTAIIGLICLSTLGCASKPEVLRFDLPQPGTAAPKGVQVVVRPPEDRRRFNENISAPDAPSVNARSDRQAALQARAVGRKRNMYNEPEGELLLGRNDSVSDFMARVATNTLTGMGFAVVEDPLEASQEAVNMDIVIDELWLWNRAETFHNIVEGKLSVSVKFDTADTPPVRIEARAERETRVPGPFDWQEVMRQLYDRTVEQLGDLLEKTPPVPRVPDFSQTETSEAADTDSETDTDTEAAPAAHPLDETATDTADTDSATAPEAAPNAP